MCREPELSAENLYKQLLVALRAWKSLDGTSANLLADLLLVRQRQRNLKLENPSTVRLATNQVLLEAIDILDNQNPEGIQVVRDRFLEEKTMQEIAHKQKHSIDHVKRVQRKAIKGLAQFIYEQENRLREAHSAALLDTLPPPSYEDGRLFGVDTLVETLIEQLESPAAPWVITLTGIGGIGKTALADLVTRRLIACFLFDRIIWLRVNPASPMAHLLHALAQQSGPAADSSTTVNAHKTKMRELLKRERCLVIIDNLDEIDDPLYFYETLSDLANPSKFLVTSRLRPPVTAAVYTQSLSDIPFTAVVTLLRELAGRRGLPELAQAPESTFRAIYNVVGGNPLALKLIVGLCGVFSLPQILADLTEAHITKVNEMYRRIYWKAWHGLTEQAQSLLLMMPMVSRAGMNREQMLAITDMEKPQLVAAIGELSERSLLEIWGTINERRYGIHSLTESFLKTEIIRWPPDSL